MAAKGARVLIAATAEAGEGSIRTRDWSDGNITFIADGLGKDEKVDIKVSPVGDESNTVSLFDLVGNELKLTDTVTAVTLPCGPRYVLEKSASSNPSRVSYYVV
jgi:hypothetical protein